MTLPYQTTVPLRPPLRAAITTLAIIHSPCTQVFAPILISTHRRGVVPRSAGRLSTSPAKLASLPPATPRGQGAVTQSSTTEVNGSLRKWSLDDCLDNRHVHCAVAICYTRREIYLDAWQTAGSRHPADKAVQQRSPNV